MRRTVLITGSSRGIGEAIAQKFAKKNDNIVLNCIHSEEKMTQLECKFKKNNPNIMGIVADVSDYTQCQNMFQAIHARFGPVDVLINNAGISYIGLFNEMTPESWQNIMNTNLNSVFNCSHLAVQGMIQRKQGTIINISSIWGNTGASCEVVYAASKGGLNSFTKALAKELAPSGINVNAIACGVIQTQMNDFLSVDEKTALKEEIPLGRFGKTDEIANLALYLSTTAAQYITGQIITVDGGLT